MMLKQIGSQDPTTTTKIYVQVNIQIFRILYIDDSTETVTLDMGISFMWEDPHVAWRCNGVNFSSHPHISRHKKDIHTMINPQLWPNDYQPGVGAFGPAWKIDNSSDTRIIKKVCMVLDPSIGCVHQYIHLVTNIHHPLDMKKFPIDVQNFCFHLRSEHTMRVMEFVPYQSRKPKIFNNDTSEWVIINELALTFNQSKPAANGQMYAEMQFNIMVSRKPEWYVLNVGVVSWMIVTASFSIFFIDEENVASRLSIILTTWLLLISLKFTIAGRLPKISYHTYLDYYLLASYGVMTCLMLYTCLQKYARQYLQAHLVCTPIDSAATDEISGGIVILSNSPEKSNCSLVFIYTNLIEKFWLYGLNWFETLGELHVMVFSVCLWTAWHVAVQQWYKFDISSNETWSEYHKMKRQLAELNAKRIFKKSRLRQVIATVRSLSFQSSDDDTVVSAEEEGDECVE